LAVAPKTLSGFEWMNQIGIDVYLQSCSPNEALPPNAAFTTKALRNIAIKV